MDIPRKTRPKYKRYFLAAAVGLVVILGTLFLARLAPAAPVVDRAVTWVDTVRRGTMVRHLRGPGTLVPEHVRWISSVTAGRVERVAVAPGERVTPETVLLEIQNPDVQVEALQAERQLADAEALLVTLRTTLENERLTQRAAVAQVQADYLGARRTAENNAMLMDRGLISQPDLLSSREQAQALETRLAVEEDRLRMIEDGIEARVRAQHEQVERLRAVARFHRERVASMQVRAGVEGVVVELPLEEGQWVTPGQTLARIVQPGPLKAVLRIPETQATDLAIGQSALIDTRADTIRGTVARIDPAAENGTVTVDVKLEGSLPPSARPNLSVDGTIEVERLEDVLYVGRPAYGQPGGVAGLFRIGPEGEYADRVSVRLGKISVSTIEVIGGLREGDQVILSDMSAWDDVERVRLK